MPESGGGFYGNRYNGEMYYLTYVQNGYNAPLVGMQRPD